MAWRLPITCLVIFVVTVVAFMFLASSPEHIVAEPRAGGVVVIDGQLMKHDDAINWLWKKKERSYSGRWPRREVILETYPPASLRCDDAFRWFFAICAAGFCEFKIVYNDGGKKEAHFYPHAAGVDFSEFNMVSDAVRYRADDFSAVREDGTPLKFRWLWIRKNGIISRGDLYDAKALLTVLAPSSNDRFIIVCEPDAPFDAVPRLQYEIERAGSRPTLLMLGE